MNIEGGGAEKIGGVARVGLWGRGGGLRGWLLAEGGSEDGSVVEGKELN